MGSGLARERSVTIPCGDVALPGTITLPGQPRGVVMFIHGSGSSRFSHRNRWAADQLADTHELVVVSGATHVCEAPGALAQAARLIGAWMVQHLIGP